MKARIDVDTRPMHIGGEVALLPAGSDSEWLPGAARDERLVAGDDPGAARERPSGRHRPRSRRRERARTTCGRPTPRRASRWRWGTRRRRSRRPSSRPSPRPSRPGCSRRARARADRGVVEPLGLLLMRGRRRGGGRDGVTAAQHRVGRDRGGRLPSIGDRAIVKFVRLHLPIEGQMAKLTDDDALVERARAATRVAPDRREARGTACRGGGVRARGGAWSPCARPRRAATASSRPRCSSLCYALAARVQVRGGLRPRRPDAARLRPDAAPGGAGRRAAPGRDSASRSARFPSTCTATATRAGSERTS